MATPAPRSVPTQQAPPSKMIAVHLNFRSSAKDADEPPPTPPTSSSRRRHWRHRGRVLRPRGCHLMGFEGEIALVIGSRARRVWPEDGWSYVRWVTAANDAGVYDLRYADRGSHLRSKGADGFTPVGHLDVVPAEVRGIQRGRRKVGRAARGHDLARLLRHAPAPRRPPLRPLRPPPLAPAVPRSLFKELGHADLFPWYVGVLCLGSSLVHLGLPETAHRAPKR
ncbi:hypothetical protein GCM10027072_73250 [Streptomyces bullii]